MNKSIPFSFTLSEAKAKMIIIVENKTSQSTLLFLNLSIYLNSNLKVVKNLKDLNAISNDLSTAHLIISRNQMLGINPLEKILLFLKEKSLSTPIIEIDSLKEPAFKMPEDPALTVLKKESPSKIQIVQEPYELKTLIKMAAAILEITPKMMANLELPGYFSIPSSFFQYLQYTPCDIFKNENGKASTLNIDPSSENSLKLLFEGGTQLLEDLVTQIIPLHQFFYIKSPLRVTFARSFSEQLPFSIAESESYEIETKEKIVVASKQLTNLATKIQSSGVDQEVIDLSQQNIAQMLEIASKAKDMSKLISMLVSDENSFRFKEAQMMIFLSFHVLKNLGLFSVKKMQAISYAALFHDMMLDDNLAKVRSEADIATKKLSQQQITAVDNHASAGAKVITQIFTVPKEAQNIIREHHGSLNGRGFCDEISSFGTISKLFFITQKWVFRVLTANEKNIEHQNLIAELKVMFKDPTSLKIIEALAIVEVNEILHALTGDLAKEDPQPTTESPQASGELPDGAEEEGGENSASVSRSLKAVLALLNQFLEQLGENVFKDDFSAADQDHFKVIQFVLASLGYLDHVDRSDLIDKVTLLFNTTLKIIQDCPDYQSDPKSRWNAIKSITEKIAKFTEELKVQIASSLPGLAKARLKDGRTFLLTAAKLGSMTCVDLLLANGTDLKAKDSSGKSALHFAAISGNLELVKKLVSLKLGVNQLDAMRRTPIVMAIHHSHHKIFDYFIAEGAHLNLKLDQGMDLVMFSASVGNLYAITKMATLNIPLKNIDFKGRDAYFLAKSKNHQEIVTFLKKTCGYE